MLFTAVLSPRHRALGLVLWIGAAAGLLGGCGRPEGPASANEPAAAASSVTAATTASEVAAAASSASASATALAVDPVAARWAQALGVPIYPGARLDPAAAGQATLPGSTTVVTAQLQSPDPTDRVAAFYRQQLLAQAQGRALMDASADGQHTLILPEDHELAGVQIVVNPSDTGSLVLIQTTRPAK